MEVKEYLNKLIEKSAIEKAPIRITIWRLKLRTVFSKKIWRHVRMNGILHIATFSSFISNNGFCVLSLNKSTSVKKSTIFPENKREWQTEQGKTVRSVSKKILNIPNNAIVLPKYKKIVFVDKNKIIVLQIL